LRKHLESNGEEERWVEIKKKIVWERFRGKD
jgi:hypothetical protein